MSLRERLRIARGVLRARPLHRGHLRAIRRTRRPQPSPDHRCEPALHAAVKWLAHAQDATPDGGLSDYSLIGGWSAAYPETTGYAIPTLLEYAGRHDAPEARTRALGMANWLCGLQAETGFFEGGHLDRLTGPSVFNTGQILQGLLAAHEDTKSEACRDAAVRATEWLVHVQDPDGSWAQHTFDGGPVAYHARIAYPLAQAGVGLGRPEAVEAAARNLRWVCALQQGDGWFERCGFRFAVEAFTHTIGYTIEGLLKAGILLEHQEWIGRAERAAAALLQSHEKHGRMAGAYAVGWRGDLSFACLTGDAQMAEIWCLLARVTGDRRYAEAAHATLCALAGRQDRGNPNPGIRGALAGSDPIWGAYTPWKYPNWAAKYLIDALHAAQGGPPQ